MQFSADQSSATNVPQHAFYRGVLQTLNQSQIPYLVGGGYALEQYTGIARDSKDLDLLVRPTSAVAVLKCLSDQGHRTQICFPHWLAKVFGGQYAVDIIFSSGNGVCTVDDKWFEHSVASEILGVKTNLCPAEELIWAKAFVMERERYDGADISHIIRARAAQLDWSRLLSRFEPHWQVFLSHLVLFGFIYPAERFLVPSWLVRELVGRLQTEQDDSSCRRVCRGTLLSRSQYRPDVETWGYEDARHLPVGSMTPEEALSWTRAGDNQTEPEQKKSTMVSG